MNNIKIVYDYDEKGQPIKKYYVCNICGNKVQIELDDVGKSTCNYCRSIVFRKNQEKVD